MSDDLLKQMAADAATYGTGISKGGVHVPQAEMFNLDDLGDKSDVLAELSHGWKERLVPVEAGHWPVKGEPLMHQLLALQESRGNNGHAFWIDAGGGKNQPLYSMILTPCGWVAMGDIKVGDEVIGSNGRPTKVMGVYPQGVIPSYKITFSDGSSTECGEDHLWKVTDICMKKDRVMTLREIMKRDHLRSSGMGKYRIPMMAPVEFDDKSFPIEPYVLGAIIGDGALTTVTAALSAPPHKAQIIERVCSLLMDGVTPKHRQYGGETPRVEFTGPNNPLTKALKGLNLHGVKSPDRFIPEEYLLGSVQQRIDLLHGLMDTDGSCHKNRTCFHSMSEQLCNGVISLVRSLGGTARKNRTDRGDKGIEWTVSIKMTINPFWARADDWSLAAYNNQPARLIKKIEHVGNVEQQCISVAADDHLYVTDDYIVTHNTFISIAEAGKLFVEDRIDCMIILAPNGPHRQWVRKEFPKWANFEWHGTYSGAHKTGKHGETHPQNTFFNSGRYDKMAVFAVNYESLGTKSVTKQINWILSKYPRAYLVVDESQKVKSHKSARTNETALLSKRCTYRRTLSGTPLLKGLEDLFPQYYIVEAGITGPFNTQRVDRNWTGARDFYCKTASPSKTSPPWVKMIVGYKNEVVFRERVRPVSTRITEDMFGKTTGGTFIPVDLAMEPKQRAAYIQMKELLLSQLDGGIVTAQNALVQLGKLMQLASGFIMDDGEVTWLSTAKIEATATILESISGDAIVWSPYIPMLDKLEEELGKRFERVTRYLGPESVDVWQAKGGIMVGNQGSGLGVGMNLQNAAANIYTSNSFSSEARWQSLKRTDRIGQTKQVRHWDLLMEDTVDHKAMESLQRKEDIATMNVDGLKDFLL